MKTILRTALASALVALATLASTGAAGAAVSTVTVAPGHLEGWQIIPDGTVPYAFVTGPNSIGNGSLQFGPIAGTPGLNKFIMFSPYGGLVSNLTAFSYDFYIDPGSSGGASDADQFYANVYVDDAANGIGFFGPGPSSTGFYDCRYDSVPLVGVPGTWTTHGFTQATTWTNIANRTGTCPATLASLTPGSRIIVIALNGGDSSNSDAGLMGGYDKVIISTNTDVTTYDFEPFVDDDGDGIPDTPPPTDKDQCKKGGWQSFNNPSFTNQGQCVSYTNHH
jgi:hypothetical protein